MKALVILPAAVSGQRTCRAGRLLSSENKCQIGWNSPILVIWQTFCSDRPQLGNRKGPSGHPEWLHRGRLHWETRAEERFQVQGLMQSSLYLWPQPSSQAGYGVSGPPVCTAGQLSHLLPVNSLRSWSRSVTDPADVPGRGSDTVGVTVWLPMSLAPRSGCVSCQQHVNPSQGGPRPSAQAWHGAFPLTGKKATV